MRRIEKRLTPAELKHLPAGFHPDGGGLYLAVRESGSRSWILRITVRGKRRDIGIGGFPDVGLADAREQAASLRSHARRGEDVLEKRRMEQRSVPTFEEAVRLVHKEVAPTLENEANRASWLRSLEMHAVPVFGKKRIDTIDTSDVLNAVKPIWTTRPDMARKTLARIRRVIDWATVQGFRNVLAGQVVLPLPNPCASIRVALPKQPSDGSHAALPYPELPAFLEMMRAANVSRSVKLTMEFTILTCVRTSEALHAAWSEFDLDAKVWNVPGARMKMRDDHRVPLSPRAIEILSEAKTLTDGSDFVFPGFYLGQPLSNMAMLMALRRMGRGDLTVHGFRATFKTWAEEKTKYDSLVIEAALAHKVGGIERHYLRTTFFEERQKLMKDWAAFATGTPRAKVVQMRG